MNIQLTARHLQGRNVSKHSVANDQGHITLLGAFSTLLHLFSRQKCCICDWICKRVSYVHPIFQLQGFVTQSVFDLQLWSLVAEEKFTTNEVTVLIWIEARVFVSYKCFLTWHIYEPFLHFIYFRAVDSCAYMSSVFIGIHMVCAFSRLQN